MKIGFDLRSILEFKDEKELTKKRLDSNILSLFSELSSSGHELFILCPVDNKSDNGKLTKIKKVFLKKYKSAVSFKFAFISKTDISNAARRNYIDVFVVADKEIAEETSTFTDSILFSHSNDYELLKNSISTRISQNRETVIPENSKSENFPSEDKLWLKRYRKGDAKWSAAYMSPYDRVTISNQDWLDETAMEFFSRRFTYGQFFNNVNSLSDIMYADGIRKGMVVPLILANTPESLVTLYALYRIKATIAPIFPLSTTEDMENKLKKISEQNRINGYESTTLFMSDLVYGRFRDIIPKNVKTVALEITNSMPRTLRFAFKHIITPKMGIKPVTYSERVISFKEYVNKKAPKVKIDTSFDDTYTAVQLYTGGTVKPKGVRLSERNLDCASRQFYNDRFAFRRGDKIAAFMPLNHSFGLIIGTHVALTLGVDLDIIMKINFKRLDKLFIKDKVNLFGGIPNMFPAIRNNKHFKGSDLSHVKYILSGGALIDATEKQRTTDFFKSHNSQAEVHDGYGLTESAGGIIYDGVPNIGVDVKIVESGTENELGYNEIGELCLSGDQIMQGYDDIALNANVLRKHSDNRIWLHTGDNAVIKSNGKVEIVGRADRMIKVNGEQVILDDIEELLNALPFVDKSAVVKKADSKRGFVPVAFIKLKPDLQWNKENQAVVEQLYSEKLTAYAKPRKTSVIKEFPVTAVGKIDFRALETLAEKGK